MTAIKTRAPANYASNFVSVKDFGAVGDGVTDDTAAIQAALDYAASQSSGGFAGKTVTIFLPAGQYLTGSLTINTKASLQGSGIESTFVQLKAGVTTPLISIPAVDVAGTSVDDTNHTVIRDMTLLGNRTDSVTTSGADAISCPDAAFALGTQYGSSVILENLEIANFAGNGITIGVNRNWALLRNLLVRYNNKSGLELAGFDHRVESCDFGVNGQHGVFTKTGGADSFVGCNFYYNGINNAYITGAFSPVWFVQCSLDYAVQNNVTIEGASIKSQYSFTNCRFLEPGRNGAANTYSHIYVANGTEAFLNVNDCWVSYDVYAPKHVIDAGLVKQIFVSGLYWDTSALPWATAWSSSFNNLQHTGTFGNGIGQRGGHNTVSLLANNAELIRGTAAGQLLLGGTSSVNIGGTESGVQLSAVSGTASLARYSADIFGPSVFVAKSRNATNGSNTTVQSGDYLGSVYFLGADDTDYNFGASIQAQVAGTPGASDMPTQLLFQTAGDTGGLVNRLAITKTGSVNFIPTTTPSAASAGDVYYDSGTNKLRCYDGTIWNDLF